MRRARSSLIISKSIAPFSEMGELKGDMYPLLDVDEERHDGDGEFEEDEDDDDKEATDRAKDAEEGMLE